MALARRQAIRSWLDAGHPVTGAFSANDATAADEFMAINLDADGTMADLVRYLAINQTRTNEGADTIRTPMIGRLASIANAAVGSDPFGRGGAWAGTGVTLKHKHSAELFLNLIQTPHLDMFNFADTEVNEALTELGPNTGDGAEVWKPADITAIKAFSEGKQSLATREDLGRVNEGDIVGARALP